MTRKKRKGPTKLYIDGMRMEPRPGYDTVQLHTCTCNPKKTAHLAYAVRTYGGY